MEIVASIIQSLISASAGLAGVGLGAYLTYAREEAKELVRRHEETSYLAIFVISHLDRFANACVDVAYDDGTEEGRPAGSGGSHKITVQAPTFDPLLLNVNWKVLPADLMYGILGFPYRLEQLEHHIKTDGFDDPPEHCEFFWARQAGYAAIGLEASALSQKLRSHAKLPPWPVEFGAWNRDQHLQDAINTIAEKKEALIKRIAERAAIKGV
jgi:hypothetical protein